MAKVEQLTKQSIFDASTPDILAFAKDVAGLTFQPDAGRSWIIEQIFEALEWDAYRPEDDATHVVIRFPITATEKHPYQGGFNGVAFAIKRGEEATVSIGQYNTIIEAAEKRFKLESLGQSSVLTEGSPASRRIPLGALDMQVIRFLNKGGAKAAETKTA